MKYFTYILSISLCLVPLSTIGQEIDSIPPRLEFKGYIKDMVSTYFFQQIDSNVSGNLIHNRLNFKYTLSSKWITRLEIRNRIFHGEIVSVIPDFGNKIDQSNGFFDLSFLWVNEKSLVAQTVLDRFLAKYSDDKWDITIGRQHINWGITNIWNPNDIFNAYNFLDFDYEERPGTDAIRIQRNLSNSSGLELAYKPGKAKEEHTAALMYKWNKSNYDFQFLSGIYLTDFVAGGGWAGNIYDTGFKGELSYFIPFTAASDSYESFNLSVMADRTFEKDWYVSLAGLYNSHPTNTIDFTGRLSDTGISPKSLFPFRYNFNAIVMKTLSPITSFSFSTNYSTEKNTLILIPTFLWNIANNFDLDFTGQSFFSESADAYENIITQIYLRGRWSF